MQMVLESDLKHELNSVHVVPKNWEVCYQQDTPVAPRFDVNAPDLYIPAMGFITYVLVAGLALGTQNRYHTISFYKRIYLFIY